jgi:hypothetical protein
MIRTPWLLGMTLLALASSALNAQETYTIKIKTSGKGAVGLVSKEKTETNRSVILKDGKVLQKQDGVQKEVEVFTETIIEREGDKVPTKLRRAYTKAQSIAMDGKTTDKPYSGKTLLIEKKGEAFTFKIEGGAELAAKDVPNLVKEMASEGESKKHIELLLPKKAVAAGETWKLGPDVLKKLLGKDGAITADFDKATATGKLTKAYKKDGKQFGVLQFNLVVPLEKMPNLEFKPGAKFAITLNVDGCIDGTSDSGEVRSSFQMNGIATAVGGIEVQFDVAGSGTDTRKELK